MNALVLGGSGFLGSHVADALARGGHRVSLFDLAPSAHRSPDQQMILGDMLDREALVRAMRDQDVVYNFAGLADIEECNERPVEAVRLNVLGNALALDMARRCGAQRYAFASTVYVHSQAGGIYRVTKQAAELCIEEYGERHGLDYTILRFGTLYGRRADHRNSVHRYLRQALEERRIVGYGTGDEIREYIHVLDAAAACVRILNPEFVNERVTITGNHPTRFRDLLSMVRELVGEDVVIELRDPAELGSQGVPAHYGLTPYSFRTRLSRKLVSDPYVDLGQGLLDCIEALHEQAPGSAEPRH